jgi:hypothetical protein
MAVVRSGCDWPEFHDVSVIFEIHLSRGKAMTTNIVIDDDLMEEALETTRPGAERDAEKNTIIVVQGHL